MKNTINFHPVNNDRGIKGVNLNAVPRLEVDSSITFLVEKIIQKGIELIS